ncbi:MAG: HPr kinase/phosphorylase [Treponema sp.]|nr:HPr kinase/phosphorylase [Treponema sp.]MBQ4236968.1 HPr kinase/phosphorylase [Treponema sp.]MBQ5384789.1 HPr kinase/phosphorylase [Treponema sp.]
MADKKFTVLDLLDLKLRGHDTLNLKCIAGRRGLSRVLTIPDINRPGLALSGFFESFAHARVQLFGRGEFSYLAKIESEGHFDVIHRFFSYEIPCCVFTRNLTPDEAFLSIAERSGCPILQSDLESTDFSIRLLRVMSNIFAPRKTLHGVLVEVSGVGMLLSGESGVGKSETALELVQRGHRLVADDVVELRCVNGNSIMGRGANRFLSHHMEIRGLGIINVAQLYGVGSIREQKEVQLVVRLETWTPDKAFDRLGTETKYTDLLGVKIPYIELPIRPGRNLPIILEAAAMNERLKSMGYFSAQDFNRNVLKWIEAGEAENEDFGSDCFY